MERNLVIVGCGGFSAETTEYIKDNQKNIKNYEYVIKGYLDVDDKNIKKYKLEKPLLGDDNYGLHKNDYFIVAIGEPKARARVIDNLRKKNAKFTNLIHYTALISSTANMGIGNIIAPYASIGPNTKIGDFNIINYHSTIAHDCTICNNNVFSPNVQITRNVRIGSDNFFATSCSILPNVTIGSKNKIAAGIVVDKNISDCSLFFLDKKTKSMAIYLKEK